MRQAIIFSTVANGTIEFVLPTDATLVCFKTGGGYGALLSTDPEATAAQIYSVAADTTFQGYIAFSSEPAPIQLNFPVRAGESVFINHDGSGQSTLFFEAISADSQLA